MKIVVVREPWRPDPLAWIHRAEARALARELRAPLVEYAGALPAGCALLRLSDPFMRRVVGELRTPYRGPGREALERCYDKYEACRIVGANGLHTPEMVLADSRELPTAPFVLKPRRGSDSIGVRIASVVPEAKRNRDHLAQARVVGREVTVALFRDEAGTGRAWFLECDAAPLVGSDSAFAASFTAAGVDRRRQLEWLVGV